MNAHDVFHSELRSITNPYLRAVVEGIFEMVPEWWVDQPSSSTGKYHPEDENGPGGMVLHTRRVVRMVQHLSQSWRGVGLTPHDVELLTAAALVHDAYRYGSGETPDNQASYGHEEALRTETEYLQPYLALWEPVVEIALFHAGRWGPATVSIPRDERYRELGDILHLADYIASRRDVSINVGPRAPF